jgi:hypothetical protein
MESSAPESEAGAGALPSLLGRPGRDLPAISAPARAPELRTGLPLPRPSTPRTRPRATRARASFAAVGPAHRESSATAAARGRAGPI